MPVADRLRSRWRSRGTPADAGGPSAPLDGELIARVADGDAAALTALYQRYGGRLVGFLQRYAGDRMVAEEILQDTPLAVWRSAHRYAGRSAVRTWLFGIARRQAHNRLRVQEPQQVPLDGLAGWAALLSPPLAAGVLVVAVDGAVRLGQPSRDTAAALQSLLEIALPLAAGVGAASLVGSDPAVELQLTLPTSYRTTILRRLVVAACWVAVIALTATAVMVASDWWHRWPGAHPPLVGQLTWLAPTVFLAGLGLLVGALSGSPALATCAVAALWFFDLAAGSWCSSPAGRGCCACSPPPAAPSRRTGPPTGWPCWPPGSR